jgi:hypothetical protein
MFFVYHKRSGKERSGVWQVASDKRKVASGQGRVINKQSSVISGEWTGKGASEEELAPFTQSMLVV